MSDSDMSRLHLLAMKARSSYSVPIHVPEDLLTKSLENLTTDDLVDVFAVIMKAKLRVAERKHGWGDAWKSGEGVDGLRESLFHHLLKGDPIDVANIAAMVWFHGASSASPQNTLHADNQRLRAAIQNAIDLCEEEDVECMHCGQEESLADSDIVTVLRDALGGKP